MKPEDKEECYIMLSSGHGITIALMNSWELCLPAQGKASPNLSMDRERLLGPTTN